MKVGVPYKFNIINMEKPTSEYNSGLKPLLYSEKKAEQAVGWTRVGTNICYYRNQYTLKDGSKSKSYYTLTFTVQFDYDQGKITTGDTLTIYRCSVLCPLLSIYSKPLKTLLEETGRQL
jgi:hypothetical protein